MPQKIYRKHANRSVREPKGFGDELLSSVRPLSTKCKEGILLLEEELASNDPDLDERCGLLDDRYEVFAVKIPGCKAHRLAVSIDLKGGKPPPATIHGAVPSGKACKNARRMVTSHLKLIDPLWE